VMSFFGKAAVIFRVAQNRDSVKIGGGFGHLIIALPESHLQAVSSSGER
jgi:hypothetical protein